MLVLTPVTYSDVSNGLKKKASSKNGQRWSVINQIQCKPECVDAFSNKDTFS